MNNITEDNINTHDNNHASETNVVSDNLAQDFHGVNHANNNKTKKNSSITQKSENLKTVSEESAQSPDKRWYLTDAVHEIKKQAKAKFIESFDVVFKLGINPRQSTQQVRGFTLLDHDYPRKIRVAVLVENEKEKKAAMQSGADRVGYDDLLEDIKADKLDFDVLVTTPDNVFKLAKFGKILGTKGLMPNPKLGTVTTDLSKAVLNIKNRQVNFRSDRYGIIHASVGKVNFDDHVLVDNVKNLAQTLTKNRPVEAKGLFLRKLWCCSTMGKSVQIDLSNLLLT